MLNIIFSLATQFANQLQGLDNVTAVTDKAMALYPMLEGAALGLAMGSMPDFFRLD